jgi:hypothetical protein
MNIKTFSGIFGGLAVTVLVAGVGYYVWDYFRPIKPNQVVDKLCKFVTEEQRMNCVAVLASDSFMKPGAIVHYQPNADGSPGLVPLPVADLLGARCQVPGVDFSSLKKDSSQQQPISIPQLIYDTNRALQAGADIDVPKLYGLTFKAGPKWSDVWSIRLTNEDAWAISLDELSALSAYKSCEILKACTDYVKSAGYRVVGTAIVAKGLSYTALNKKGDLISLAVSAKSEEFTASVGSNTDITSSADATIKSPGARVVGVRLMPAAVFEGKQVCDEVAAFQSPTGAARVTIGGGGGRGNIGAIRSDQRPIGEGAVLKATGNEASECDAGFERIQSDASAEAKVVADGPGRLRLSYHLQAKGGHYVTKAACVGPLVVGKTGHDTTATATAEVRGTILLMLRANSRAPLKVSHSNLPPDSQIDVRDWKGQRLQIARKEFIKGDEVTKREDFPSRVSGDGSYDVGTTGPGLYRIEVSFQLNASVTGGAFENKEQTASISVSLAP